MLKDYIEEKKKLFLYELEKRLDYDYKYPDELGEAIKYSVLNGGKRLRPIFSYIISDIFGKNYDEVIDIALAIEYIHCYSLIHDDLPAMDNDDYRRGKLTTHKKYNEATAILAGDSLLTSSFKIIADSKKINDNLKVRIISLLSDYSGFNGMVGGQFLDIEAETKEVGIETLEYIHTNKTGKLLRASIELPLIAFEIDKLDSNKYNALVEYAKLVGLAFQIKDDLLDIEGNFSETGKKSNDVEHNKTTYPKIYGVEKTKQMLVDIRNKNKSIINENFTNGDILIEISDYISNRGE